MAVYLENYSEVRVYHRTKAVLPHHYVSSQHLCLRATTDCWVNDVTGQPFFVMEKPTDPDLIKVLKNTIVPKLLVEMLEQPSEQIWKTKIDSDFLSRDEKDCWIRLEW